MNDCEIDKIIPCDQHKIDKKNTKQQLQKRYNKQKTTCSLLITTSNRK